MSDADDKGNKKPDQEAPFASRWAHRKRQVTERRSAEAQPADRPPEAKAIPLATIVPDGTAGKMQTRTEADRLAAEQAAEKDSPPHLTDSDMPAVETLDETSDFSGFMSPGVSEKLRKIALRKLFAGAGFNIRDGLDDYDDDFTRFEGLGDLVTCDMKHRAEMQAEKKAREEQEELEARKKEELEGLAAEQETGPEDERDDNRPIERAVDEVQDDKIEELADDVAGSCQSQDGPKT